MFDLTPETLFTLSKAFLFILACWVLATNLMWLAVKLVKCHGYMTGTVPTSYEGNAEGNIRYIAASFTFIMVYLFI